MGGKAKAGMEPVTVPSGAGNECPLPSSGTGLGHLCQPGSREGSLEQRGLGDYVETTQDLQFPGICPPLSDAFSLYFLVAAGRHTTAANPTDLLNILGRALFSQLIGPKRQLQSTGTWRESCLPGPTAAP